MGARNCGEAPATYPEVAAFLTRHGVDSMSVNPQSLARTLTVVFEAEAGGANPQCAVAEAANA